MKSNNTKKIDKMMKKHGLLAIFAFILTCMVATMMLSYFVYSLVFYLLEAKLSSEYESISYMARIYEQSISEDYEGDVWSILNEDGRDYIIRDKNGTLLVGDKDNTCSEEGAPVKLSGIEGDVEVFVDKEYPFVTLDREGLVTV